MLPLLTFVADGREHTLREAVEVLAEQLGLTDDDRKDTLPSAQPRFVNRVGWARTYLVKAGLLASVHRGTFRLTERGHKVLAGKPHHIGTRDLECYPEFVAFKTKTRKDLPDIDEQSEPRTPEEILAAGYDDMRTALAQELLEYVRSVTPRFFEELVVELLLKMGYGGSRADAGAAIGQSGDDGIDGTIKEDRLGLDVIYVQAKRWQNTVGRPELQGFVGSLEGHHARKGVFITTSRFSGDAREYSERTETKKVVLIDGEELAQLMIDYGVGVQDVATYTVKRVDSDYFTGGA
ncbi:MAG TPA: restriction endonuclease [Chloroflexota bacterium]|nr:restriction endonuclease [Chloroflexota bacterium]